MFPSPLNLIISTIVFFLASWYLGRFLHNYGLERGFARSFIVFSLASLVSCGSGYVVDWTQGDEPVTAAKSAEDMSKLINAVAGLKESAENQ